jgi:ABC-2 type transport system permease protein
VSLGEAIEAPEGLSYLAFLVPGLVMMSAMNNAFQNASGCIISAKFTGELEDFRTSPLSKPQIILGLAAGAVIRGLAVAMVTFFVGSCFHVFMEGHLLIPHSGLALLYFLVMGCLIFGHLGVWLAFWARSFEQLSGIAAFILLPLLYLGGVFFSLQNLHPAWQAASKVNPVHYLINGVRFGMLGYADIDVAQAARVAIVSLLLMHALAYHAMAKGSFQRW